MKDELTAKEVSMIAEKDKVSEQARLIEEYKKSLVQKDHDIKAALDPGKYPKAWLEGLYQLFNKPRQLVALLCLLQGNNWKKFGDLMTQKQEIQDI